MTRGMRLTREKMEQVEKRPFWKSIARAHSQAWRKSIRWPFMLAISGCTLLALLIIILGISVILPAGKASTPSCNLVMWVSAAGVLLWLASNVIIFACLDRMILRRIETLQKGAGQVTSGNYQYRLPIAHSDEVSMLAEQINLLASGLERREVLLARAREKALDHEHFKSNLLGRVSHDLRQPLGVILGFSEMIRDEIIGPVTNQQRRAVGEIISGTTRLSNLITDLLDTARMETHNLQLRVDDFSPELLLRQLHDQVNGQARHKGLTFTTELDPALPMTMRGDPNRLLLILKNLAGNAIKFTEQGGVYVRMFRSGPEQWAFSITDTGQGISANALEHIFEPFWQDSDPATRDKGGIGLGLAIVQQLVQLMGGQIRVESTVGEGSTFLVILPLDRTTHRGDELWTQPPPDNLPL